MFICDRLFHFLLLLPPSITSPAHMNGTHANRFKRDTRNKRDGCTARSSVMYAGENNSARVAACSSTLLLSIPRVLELRAICLKIARQRVLRRATAWCEEVNEFLTYSAALLLLSLVTMLIQQRKRYSSKNKKEVIRVVTQRRKPSFLSLPPPPRGCNATRCLLIRTRIRFFFFFLSSVNRAAGML